MKKILKTSLLTLVIVCASFVTGSAQVVVKIKPAKPKVLVIKPAKLKHGHIWRTGHWKWNKKDHKYVWTKAHWVKENNGHHWVGGHWVKNSHGHAWTAGHWKKGKAQKKAPKKVHNKKHKNHNH
ncbi:MAG: hypothetical protein ACJAZ2_000404 [Glaciecola sp.]|jgi:hypothetical protein